MLLRAAWSKRAEKKCLKCGAKKNRGKLSLFFLERASRFELPTSTLARSRSAN